MVKITLFGLPGTGTSTVGKLYAKTYSLRFISSGNLFREEAKKIGIDVYELNKLAKKDSSIDKDLDNQIRQIGQEENEIIVDSRLAWYFIPDSFKVKLFCSDITRVNRIQERDGGSLTEILSKTKEREYLEKKRYLKLYGIEDYSDDSHFDYIIDTTKLMLKKIIDLIEKEIKRSYN